MAKKASKKEVATSKGEAADPKKEEGLLAEISQKISAAKNIRDLEALNDRVFDIWGDSVPAKIQSLAAKKAEEIQESTQESGELEIDNEDPENWESVTSEQVAEAEKDGTLVGFNSRTMKALIKK